MKLGYPQGLINTQWGETFSLFFESQNIKIEKSPESSQQLFLKGKKFILDEFCLPVKLFSGHVKTLVDDCNLPIFIPFISGNKERNSFLCPIEVRITDILINSGIIPAERVLSPRFEFNNNLQLSFLDGNYPGDFLKIPFHLLNDNVVLPGDFYNDVSINKPNILLLGRSYVLDDPWLNGGIKKTLISLGMNISSLVPQVENRDSNLSLKDYSHFALTGQLLRDLESMMKSTQIDGIVFITPFLCGPDCGVGSDILRFIEKEELPPVLEIVLDEHNSQEGRQTRLEAFCDLIATNNKEKTKNENMKELE